MPPSDLWRRTDAPYSTRPFLLCPPVASSRYGTQQGPRATMIPNFCAPATTSFLPRMKSSSSPANFSLGPPALRRLPHFPSPPSSTDPHSPSSVPWIRQDDDLSCARTGWWTPLLCGVSGSCVLHSPPSPGGPPSYPSGLPRVVSPLGLPRNSKTFENTSRSLDGSPRVVAPP